MPSSFSQNWSQGAGWAYLAAGTMTNFYVLNSSQVARTAEAFGLWDDVANVTTGRWVDDFELARKSQNFIEEKFLGVTIRSYYENSLPSEWTRVFVGDIADPNLLGINRSTGTNARYHEVYVDISCEGSSTFSHGSVAFETLIHEIGHSVLTGPHISNSTAANIINFTVMNTTGSFANWHASTPMTWDIDAMISKYGAASATRLGNDTYGFHAVQSGPYRAAFDFNVNKRPLVTIYDNGGVDTLDASGFRTSSGNWRPVLINLQQGPEYASRMLDGGKETFAIIYRTTTVENAIGGGGNDVIIGNSVANKLTGGLGTDSLTGGGGADAFVFNSSLTLSGRDKIADFAPNLDDIHLSKAIFIRIGATLDATEFRVGTSAQDSNDWIVYSPSTGNIAYDPDGSGSATAMAFATVSVGINLTVSDFVMI